MDFFHRTKRDERLNKRLERIQPGRLSCEVLAARTILNQMTTSILSSEEQDVLELNGAATNVDFDLFVFVLILLVVSKCLPYGRDISLCPARAALCLFAFSLHISSSGATPLVTPRRIPLQKANGAPSVHARPKGVL